MTLLQTTAVTELVVDAAHFQRVVIDGIFSATISLDLMTADFKAMLIPTGYGAAHSIVHHLRRLADRGVEIRLLHAGTPSAAALREQGTPFVLASGGHVEPPPPEFVDAPMIEKPFTIDRVTPIIQAALSA